MNSQFVAPGLQPGMTNDAYHHGQGVSKSHLDDVAKPNAPIHYWHKRLNPDREPEERTPALILGDAIHKAVLEPDLIVQHFITIPEDAPPKPTSRQINAKEPSLASQGSISYWRDFTAENAGKAILKKADFDMVLAVRDSVHMHPLARGLLSGGQAEQTYFAIDPETGELIKCRLDYDRIADANMIVDLKSTEDASADNFGWSATKYRYDVQGGWYPHVIHSAYGPGHIESFVFVAIEKAPPYAVGVYYLDPADQAEGLRKGMADLRLIKACRDANHWPHHVDEEPEMLAIRRKRAA